MCIALVRLMTAGDWMWLPLILLVFWLSDLVTAWRHERLIKAGRVVLHNDIKGRTALAERDFTDRGDRYQGKVRLGQELWDAVSSGRITKGDELVVTNRDGMILFVRHQ